MMNQLVYYSSVNQEIGQADIDQILESSRINNAKNNVTGLLYFNSDFFLQALEGEQIAVNDTYIRIAKDLRHDNPCLVHYAKIEKRLFPDWEMQYLANTQEVNQSLYQFFPKPYFDPVWITSRNCTEVLKCIAQHL